MRSMLAQLLIENVVVNASHIDDFVDQKVEDVKLDAGKTWIKKKLRKYIFNNPDMLISVESLESLQKMNVSYEDYVVKAFQESKPVYVFDNQKEQVRDLGEDVNHMIDYFNSLWIATNNEGRAYSSNRQAELEMAAEAKRIISKLSQTGIMDIGRQSEKWFKFLEKYQDREFKSKGFEIIMRWPNGLYAIKYDSSLEGVKAMNLDGTDLGNCLRGGYYDKQVNDGSSVVVSLRQPGKSSKSDDMTNDQAVVAFAFSPSDSGKLKPVECKGGNNSIPSPVYIPYIKDVLHKVGSTGMSHDLSALGFSYNHEKGRYGTFEEIAETFIDEPPIKLMGLWDSDDKYSGKFILGYGRFGFRIHVHANLVDFSETKNFDTLPINVLIKVLNTIGKAPSNRFGQSLEIALIDKGIIFTNGEYKHIEREFDIIYQGNETSFYMPKSRDEFVFQHNGMYHIYRNNGDIWVCRHNNLINTEFHRDILDELLEGLNASGITYEYNGSDEAGMTSISSIKLHANLLEAYRVIFDPESKKWSMIGDLIPFYSTDYIHRNKSKSDFTRYMFFKLSERSYLSSKKYSSGTTFNVVFVTSNGEVYDMNNPNIAIECLLLAEYMSKPFKSSMSSEYQTEDISYIVLGKIYRKGKWQDPEDLWTLKKEPNNIFQVYYDAEKKHYRLKSEQAKFTKDRFIVKNKAIEMVQQSDVIGIGTLYSSDHPNARKYLKKYEEAIRSISPKSDIPIVKHSDFRENTVPSIGKYIFYTPQSFTKAALSVDFYDIVVNGNNMNHLDRLIEQAYNLNRTEFREFIRAFYGPKQSAYSIEVTGTDNILDKKVVSVKARLNPVMYYMFSTVTTKSSYEAEAANLYITRLREFAEELKGIDADYMFFSIPYNIESMIENDLSVKAKQIGEICKRIADWMLKQNKKADDFTFNKALKNRKDEFTAYQTLMSKVRRYR